MPLPSRTGIAGIHCYSYTRTVLWVTSAFCRKKTKEATTIYHLFLFFFKNVYKYYKKHLKKDIDCINKRILGNFRQISAMPRLPTPDVTLTETHIDVRNSRAKRAAGVSTRIPTQVWWLGCEGVIMDLWEKEMIQSSLKKNKVLKQIRTKGIETGKLIHTSKTQK